jgi:hypothetical protein
LTGTGGDEGARPSEDEPRLDRADGRTRRMKVDDDELVAGFGHELVKVCSSAGSRCIQSSDEMRSAGEREYDRPERASSGSERADVRSKWWGGGV